MQKIIALFSTTLMHSLCIQGFQFLLNDRQETNIEQRQLLHFDAASPQFHYAHFVCAPVKVLGVWFAGCELR